MHIRKKAYPHTFRSFHFSELDLMERNMIDAGGLPVSVGKRVLVTTFAMHSKQRQGHVPQLIVLALREENRLGLGMLTRLVSRHHARASGLDGYGLILNETLSRSHEQPRTVTLQKTGRQLDI